MSDDTAVCCQKAAVGALPVDLDYITEELKIRSKAELFEDEDTRVQSLGLLRSMLEKEQSLRWQDDDLFLLAFLRVKKFDVSRAFNLIKGFYTFIGKHGDSYYNLNFDHTKRTMEANTIYILPYRDCEGSPIIMFKCGAWDPSALTAVELMVCSSLGFIQALRSPSTQIAGFQLIADFEGYSLKHIMHTTPAVVGFFTSMIQNALPLRMRGFHMIHQNPFVSHIWPLVKRFLSKKLRDRIHVHGDDMKSLHKFFHPSLLPADYEGELPMFNNADWRERMEASADYIKHVLSFGYEKYLTEWRKKHGIIESNQ